MSIPYSRIDRTLHYAAFSSLQIQVALGDIERMLYGNQYCSVKLEKPVFITALPRAGTTVLLSVLSRLSDFATHTYRDMPFVLIPIIWNRISRNFRTQMSGQERAHGDGLLIDYDSPEAFDEVVWKAYWQKHYKRDRIIPWSGTSADSEFVDYMCNHMRKIIALHQGRNFKPSQARYISKNNANIARLNLLIRLFPDCRILIPLRHPWHHSRSMAIQHERFTSLHSKDSFSRRYMEWLGHYEFGAALKPIDFDNWLQDGFEPDTDEFWLAYWHKAYSAIQKALLLDESSNNITLIDYDRLCKTPYQLLPTLARKLEIDNHDDLSGHTDLFRPSRTYETDPKIVTQPLYQSCMALYESLQKQCLNE